MANDKTTGKDWNLPGANEADKGKEKAPEQPGQGNPSPAAGTQPEDGKTALTGGQSFEDWQKEKSEIANARGAADLSFFNGTSSEIHIHHGDASGVVGVVVIKPMTSEIVKREIADKWLKTPVGRAYVDGGLLKTKEVEEIDFSSHSDLTPPKELTQPATAGNVVAEVTERKAEAGAIK